MTARCTGRPLVRQLEALVSDSATMARRGVLRSNLASRPARADVVSTVVYVCRGSKCRKRNKPKGLEKRFRIEVVKCQKVCKGPVVGIRVDGTLEWFRKVKNKDVKALRKIAKGKRVPTSLAERRSKKRSGKLRD